MSQQYDNNMRGVLFPNDRKEKDTHPDFKGSCEINGVEYWLSAWKETGNKPRLSISIQAKEQQRPNIQEQANKTYDEMNPPPVQDEKDYFGF